MGRQTLAHKTHTFLNYFVCFHFVFCLTTLSGAYEYAEASNWIIVANAFGNNVGIRQMYLGWNIRLGKIISLQSSYAMPLSLK